MLRIKPRYGKYQYAITPSDSKLLRSVGLLSIGSISLLAWGFYYFLNMSLLAAAIFMIPLAIIVLYLLIGALLMASFRGFDIESHEQKVADYWRQSGHQPRVGIMIPVAGESPAIVRQTVKAAMNVDYKNKIVVICDDTPRGKYRKLASDLMCHYIQHDQPGVMKKAGNVNYAISQLPDLEQVLVLDADFVPRREILRELIPYAGDHVGIVQTPQHFRMNDKVYAKSKIEFGAAMVQKDFYRITQVARNRFGSAICVGTNALYNRQALDHVGGFEGVGKYDPWTHSEDVNTGLKMLNYRLEDGKPYRITYVPVQLAIGICPDDYYSFYKQQARWSTGSTRLAFSSKTLFSKVLNPIQKLCYFSNALYYFYTMSILLMPLQFVAIIASGHQFQWVYTLLFVPQLIVTFLVTPFVLRREPEPIVGMVTVTATAYTFVQAVWLSLIRRPIGWEATGQKAQNGKKAGKSRFSQYKLGVALYVLLVYGLTLALAIREGAFGFDPSIFFQVIFACGLIAQVAHLTYLYSNTAAGRFLLSAKEFLTKER